MDPERPLAGAPWLKAAESRRVLAAITAEGAPARFVGGCVRDTLLDPEHDPADLDLATAEPPEQVLALLERAGIRALPTGLAHGTVTALVGERRFEITTLRRDVETFGRHARVRFTDDFTEDAARRDLTINAMSCDLEGRLFDPFGGREDLFRGRIRFVGRARERIREDYLRILRFFRFYARYGRPPPDAEALTACAEERAGLRRLSGERIRQELERLLVAPGAVEALRLMIATGCWAELLPSPDLSALERLLLVCPDGDWLLRLACLLRDGCGDGRAEEAALRLRLSRRERERLRDLLSAELPRPGAAREWAQLAYRVGPERARDRLCLAAAKGLLPAAACAEARAFLAAFAPPRFPLRGRDLVAAGLAPGPEVGRWLRRLERWWVERDFAPDKAQLLAEWRRLQERSRGAAAED